MKCREFVGLPLLALFLALAPTALASNTWYVDGVNGSDSNNCMSAQTACKTIGHAISLASSGDSIIVGAGTYTENLTISFSLDVIGAGANTTIIDGGGVGSVVTIPNFDRVTLSNVTIRSGYALFGGGIDNYGNGWLTINNSTISGNLVEAAYLQHSYGGGIYNNGRLAINNSTVTGNRAQCGHLNCASYGGGIYNIGELLINGSTVNGNNAYAHFAYSQGGGIVNAFSTAPPVSGILTISNSTISGNGANLGGGIFGAATINNSTLSGNRAYIPGYGGAIFGNATLQNSIVANSPLGGNCYGNMTSKGYNLSSDATCRFSGPGDLNNTDPKLGTLGYYGGPTQTIPLLTASPAIDAGNPSGCTDSQGNLLKTDQRGMPRPDPEDTGGCDMGAYESQSD